MTAPAPTEPIPPERALSLLRILGGAPKKCRGRDCNAMVWWVITRNRSPMPVDADLQVHWATCPNAKDFKR